MDPYLQWLQSRPATFYAVRKLPMFVELLGASHSPEGWVGKRVDRGQHRSIAHAPGTERGT